jgi:hypothetical protein
LPDGSTSVSIKPIIPNVSVTDAAAGHEFHTEFLGPEKAFDLGWIASFRSPANQAAQVSLVSGHATAHEDSMRSVDVDDVDAAFAGKSDRDAPGLRQVPGLHRRCARRLPFRKLVALPGDAGRAYRPHGIGLGGRLCAQV